MSLNRAFKTCNLASQKLGQHQAPRPSSQQRPLEPPQLKIAKRSKTAMGNYPYYKSRRELDVMASNARQTRHRFSPGSQPSSFCAALH